MSRHAGRVVVTLLVIVGVTIHIGLGYRFGLVIAGSGLAGHLILGVLARKMLHRKADRAGT